ncbi:MAG: GTP cyclohydrolase II [bacterium]|nr:GTP cyclohydrolase II [bacterium]
MFSYVNKNIREKFEENGKLVTVNKDGKPVHNGNNEENDSSFISILGPVPLPIMIGKEEVIFSWYPFVRRVQLSHVLDAANKVENGDEENFRELLQTNMSVNSLLASPGFLEHSNPPVRVHSCCMTGDIFGSLRCECGSQLDSAFEYAFKNGGAVIYMSGHEGRGIGLWAKAMTYLLQDEGQDTYQANLSLGLPEDSRDFTDAAVVLRYLLKEKPIRLLSNNPLKLDHLKQAGQSVSEVVPLVTGVCEHNIDYMRSKKSKGHLLPELK